MMCLQVCNAIFDQGNVLQNAGERRHLLAPASSGATGDEIVCDGRVQASSQVIDLPSCPMSMAPVPGIIGHAGRP